MANFIEKAVRVCKGKLGAIKRGELNLNKSEVWKLIERLKTMDEAAYEECMKDYIALAKR